jgi:REP element-mobilizing transposase RayT
LPENGLRLVGARLQHCAVNTSEEQKEDQLKSGFHFRGQLPHIKRAGATYFVTFRLGDSLPANEIARLKREREAIVEEALARRAPLTWHEEQGLFAWYCDKVEALLDSGAGGCWMRRREIAELVANAIKFFADARYSLHAWVVMPNHVHAVLTPREEQRLSDILHSWKSFTSKKARALLKRNGQRFWQAESYDHRVRDDDERARIVNYVENNPVKARLCARPEEWEWSSAYGRG